MLNQEEKIKKFLFEVNRVLSPVLKIDHTPWPTVSAMFVVSLCETPYALPGVINVNDAFDILITEYGESIFGKKPTLNNTHTTFWFSE